MKYDGDKIKVAPLKYHTTRKDLFEGKIIDFILVEDTRINNKLYKKGTTIKARVETLSQNGAYGVPADLVIGNFTLPDNLTLHGDITQQGANRSLWVYPTGYILTPFFLIGLLIFPQAISLWTPLLSTINLSLGERPVYLPVVTHKEPELDKIPSLFDTANSINFLESKFLYIFFGLIIPIVFKSNFFI